MVFYRAKRECVRTSGQDLIGIQNNAKNLYKWDSFSLDIWNRGNDPYKNWVTQSKGVIKLVETMQETIPFQLCGCA